MNDISIFQKHLGQTFNHSNNGFAANIQDINCAIGSLQTLNLKLKKCQQLLQEDKADEFHNISSKCEFMGKDLFDYTIQISLFGEKRSITVGNLYDLNSQLSKEELLEYIQNSQNQINEILSWIAYNIDIHPQEQQTSTLSQQNCNLFIKA